MDVKPGHIGNAGKPVADLIYLLEEILVVSIPVGINILY